ncbi:MAG: ABC transporter permease [Candidatus Eremiobacteraeota bacterium]|nr:ABC transporter permease [Candidatus Eremiobacteraeota bacterium]
MSILKTLSIASMTIEESLRKKIFYILLFLSLILVAFSSFFTSFGLGAQVTIMKDLSLFGISFFGLLFTISLFMNAVPGEIENRTIYPILAQPITRATYLWGKFLGIYSLIAVNLFVLGLELMVVLFPHENSWNFEVLKAVVLIILQCGLIGAFMMLFSLISSYPLAISATLFLFMVGNISYAYMGYLQAKLPPLFWSFLRYFKILLPKFDVFNIKNAVVHGHALIPGYMLTAIAYGVAYLVAVMMITLIIFEKKDL